MAAHPTDSRARALLALAYLSTHNAPGAQAQLDIVRAQAPRAPETHLAWAQWYAAQHDYLAAAEEYRLALSDAAPDERGTYALALARFHIDIALERCENGLPAAEEAARALPNDPRAWTTLANVRFGCGDPAGSRAAAEQALQRAPASAEASYYLGRALAALGDRPAARLALINAADLAPALALARTRRGPDCDARVIATLTARNRTKHAHRRSSVSYCRFALSLHICNHSGACLRPNRLV